MACIYTGTLSTVEQGFLIKDTGAFDTIFVTNNLDTAEQIALTTEFSFDTDQTQAQIQAAITAATLPGNVITLLSIDETGSVFSVSVTRPCPAQNLESQVQIEENTAIGTLTSSCSCVTNNRCIHEGTLSFPTVVPDSGTFVIQIPGVTNEINFDTSLPLVVLQGLVFASVINKTTDNVFIVSFDENGLVLGFELIRACPQKTLTIEGELGFIIDMVITEVGSGPGGPNQNCFLGPGVSLVVGQEYTLSVPFVLVSGGVTFRATVGADPNFSFDSGVQVFQTPPPINTVFEFTFIATDTDATVCITHQVIENNTTMTIQDILLSTIVDSVTSTADCVCRRARRGVVPPVNQLTCICIEPGYFAQGNAPSTINNGKTVYYKTGRTANGWDCYSVNPNPSALQDNIQNGTCKKIDKNGRIF